jgi:hypothetical protein
VPPSFDIEAVVAQLMTSMSALQREVNLIGERVEQGQIDIRECLKYIIIQSRMMMMIEFFLCYVQSCFGY